ncbi:SDR family NAD(P)-dependent oxidoreductase [Luminiphilus sp.]|nr:SDR family NAD(P)-dependent oxidoreductase [Luminiphilus sp.]
MDPKNKVALVTGGGSGLGLALARALGLRGATVVLADRDLSAAQNAARALQELGIAADHLSCDVASAQQVSEVVGEVITRHGDIDILINNAGVALGGTSGEINLEDWRWIVDINLMGVVHGVEAVVPFMRKTGGYILNVASLAGMHANPDMGPYNATKFAVVGYSEGLQQELAGANIGVSVLCPAWIKTDIHRSALQKPSGNTELDQHRVEAMEDVISNGIDASDVAEWAIDCLQAERFYILTHPEFLPMLEKRHQRVLADYAAASSYFSTTDRA